MATPNVVGHDPSVPQAAAGVRESDDVGATKEQEVARLASTVGPLQSQLGPLTTLSQGGKQRRGSVGSTSKGSDRKVPLNGAHCDLQKGMHLPLSGSRFTRALMELGETHEQEVQALRERLEARLRVQASEIEELRAATPLKNGECGESSEEIHLKRPAGTPPPYCDLDAWEEIQQAPSVDTKEQARVLDRRRSSQTGVMSNPSNRISQATNKSKGFSHSSTSSSAANMKVLSDDLALIKGWQRNTFQHFSDSKAAHLRITMLGAMVAHQAFDAVCSIMIISNAVLMGIAVDWSVKNFQEEAYPFYLELFDRLFTCWFLLELLIRVLGMGLNFLVAKDWTWNLFDFLVVTIDVVSTLVQMATKQSENSSNNVSIVRLLRVLRVTRALRIVRVFRFFRELRMMVFSVLRSGTSLVWSIVLFFMDVFLFSVYLTQQVTFHKREESQAEYEASISNTTSLVRSSLSCEFSLEEKLDEYFGSIPRAIYTLFMCVSGGISWVEVSSPLLQVHWSNSLILVFFVFFTVYALTNIITGIFVDTAIQSAQSDRDEVIQTQLQHRDSTLQQMRDLFLEADVDQHGSITLQELESHLRDKRVRAHMAALGLQLDEARGLFRLLDLDKSGALTIDEFIFGCMRLKGNARSIDLATLMYENKKMFTIMSAFFDFVEEEFGRIDRLVNQISRAVQPRGDIAHFNLTYAGPVNTRPEGTMPLRQKL